MPQKAQLAAMKMGYTAQLWDEDATIPYDSKKFHETTKDERLAAMYLGLNPIDAKLDIWWDEVDKETQRYAIDIGWDKEKWDDHWELHDLSVEQLYWNDLSDKQRRAASYFGYCKYTWDGDGEDDLNFKPSPVKINHLSPPHKVEQPETHSGSWNCCGAQLPAIGLAKTILKFVQ